MDLASKKCVPCESGAEPLAVSEIQKNLASIPDWKLDGKVIYREFELS